MGLGLVAGWFWSLRVGVFVLYSRWDGVPNVRQARPRCQRGLLRPQSNALFPSRAFVVVAGYLRAARQRRWSVRFIGPSRPVGAKLRVSPLLLIVRLPLVPLALLFVSLSLGL